MSKGSGRRRAAQEGMYQKNYDTWMENKRIEAEQLRRALVAPGPGSSAVAGVPPVPPPVLQGEPLQAPEKLGGSPSSPGSPKNNTNLENSHD